MDNVISIIVTGAGAPGIAGTIYSIKNNPYGEQFKIISTDIKDDVVGKYMSDSFYVVPPPESQEEYINTLKEIVNREEVKVIVPQTTRESITLSKYKNIFYNMGVKVIISDYRSVLEANDKFYLLEKSKAIGVPYPMYFLTKSEEEFLTAVEKLGYPEKRIVIKPRISNGMRGLRILTKDTWNAQKFLSEKPEGIEINLENLLAILRNGEWPELLVTEYLEGPEYTVDVFRNENDTIAIPRLRRQIRSGITFEAQVELRQDIIEYSQKLAEALDLKYCFGFQYKLSSEGIPKILECNPRVQGTMVVSTFAGFNMIYYAIKQALGFKVDLRQIKVKDKVQFKRYWGGLGIAGNEILGKI